ncbi:MAG: carbohydrate ABC transporter substrate-binding protein, partial [Candidatus Omnitrophica bacterium]|nr:carbohydrate ABC transporter substrate-binding protein [Candidatus Omnitrophota bacterium]
MKDRIKVRPIFPFIIFLVFLLSLVTVPAPVRGEQHIASENAVEKWADHFDISVLSVEDRKRELEWFRSVSAGLRGRTIRSAAENIETHFWERDVLSRAFYELTGIKVEHHIIPEGQIIRSITEQMMTGRMIYDIYVNDSDLIGTHVRLARVVDLTEYMNNGGRRYTGPFLDLDDFLNLEFGQDYNGHQLQLPDQQFPILYWFRYDWFTDPGVR